MKILVAVASRHGATRGIAQAISEVLDTEGFEVTLADVDGVEDITEYEAVILGSAVYAGHWMRSAKRFIREHGDQIALRPVWIFSSGPLGDPPQPNDKDSVEIRAIAERILPQEHRIFAGKLDPSELHFTERALMRAVHAPAGDFRNWDEVRAWARGIAALLRRGLV